MILSEIIMMYEVLRADSIFVVYGHDRPKTLSLDVEKLCWVDNNNWHEVMVRARPSYTHVDCPGVTPNTITSIQSTQTR